MPTVASVKKNAFANLRQQGWPVMATVKERCALVTHLTSTVKISSGYMAAHKTTMTLGTCGAAAVGTANERSIRALAYGDSDQCSY